MKRVPLWSAIVCLLVLAFPAAHAGAQEPSISSRQAPPCPHKIDAAKCPFCDPDRIERLGMCKEHGVPEALCVKCKPILKAAFIAAGDWCAEHDTPESRCRICNPEAAKSASDRGLVAGVEHRWRHEPSATCSTSSTIVTLKSSDVARTMGLEVIRVQVAPLTRVVERNAEVAYNANRYARLASRAGGAIAEVKRDLGERVTKGDVLAVVDSTDLGGAKSDLLQSLATMKLWEANAARERELVNTGIGVEREALEAETKAAESRIAVNRARQRLGNLGLTREQVSGVETAGDTSSLLELVAPFDGIVVERAAVIGEVVEPGRPVLSIADVRTMWAIVDLIEADIAAVQTGQKATLTVDGLPGKSFSGTMTWISTQIDPKTRTLKARVEIENSSGLLRANMLGRARIGAGASVQAITIPKEAVQWEGCCNIAFVRGDDTTFTPARLLIAHDTGDGYEIAEGLKVGDAIVTRGSYLLKNEILKNAVGAGCCEVDHLGK